MFSRREFLRQTAVATLVASAASQSSSAARAKAPAGGSSSESKPPGTMKSYTIPHTELEVSRLAYGCAMLGLDWNGSDAVARTAATIRTAYEQGITFFDTADIYGQGKSELALGEFLRGSPGLRQRIVIQSKCGIAAGGSIDNSREHITTAVEGSLERLGTDRLDILLLHWPDSLVEPQEVAKAFDELHRAGRVRYFGVSNHSACQIELLQKHVRQPLVANQIQLGLAHWFTVAGPSKGAVTHARLAAAPSGAHRAGDRRNQTRACDRQLCGRPHRAESRGVVHAAARCICDRTARGHVRRRENGVRRSPNHPAQADGSEPDTR